MIFIIAALCLVVLFCAATVSGGAARSRLIRLYPSSPASPALQHALLPEVRDTIPGNAAEQYRRTLAVLKQDGPPEHEWRETVYQWSAVPDDEFPREEARKLLLRAEMVLQALDAAARGEYCDWGLTERLRNNGFSDVLPDIQRLRAVAALLALHIRCNVIAGRTAPIVRDLQTGLAMARHVAESPMFIPALVGAAFAGIMLNQLEGWVQRPGAPSLYWPLTDLPRPFLDLRRSMQGERVWTYGNFPGAAEAAADLHAGPWPRQQAEKMTARICEALGDDPAEGPIWSDPVDLQRRLAARHEAAKQSLIEEGRPKELVDAMPPVQAALLVALRQYDQLFDDYLKVHSLPYWEAQAAVEEVEARRAALTGDGPGRALPIARVFLPLVKGMFAARTRLDRHIAALRCVEAVRLHAASCDGHLPGSLDQIKAAPVPADPATGRPFDYELARDRAVLSGPALAGQPPFPTNAFTYELMIQH
jgi:hypothetical protein